uniref:Tick transposon n=1 Tax=Rhipicephalus zambeziensis TaxID=60191 RepID=A0A224ZA17_9ACAR
MEEHICWAYWPRSCKKLMPYHAAQSIVKRDIAFMRLEGALAKSCPHRMQESFDNQVSWLYSACILTRALCQWLNTCFKKSKGKRRSVNGSKKKPVVFPYAHKVAHNLKKVANRYKVPVVFPAPRKLSGMCPRISRGPLPAPCGKKHARHYVTCATGVVYEIPLSCGRVYIGQTGRCVNDRAREQDLSLKNNLLAHLPMHCSACGCEARFANVTILGRSKEVMEREMLEAYLISDTSVVLRSAEFDFFERFLNSHVHREWPIVGM